MEAANPTESALTISEVIGQVHCGRCLVPVPQEGELIWPPEQIEKLFGLLMQERSIGQFIFWSVGRDRVGDYHFCDFSGDGNECPCAVDPTSSIGRRDNVAVVIDGKRRLASLYVGLVGLNKGSVPSRSQETEDFYQSRKLYLNLLSGTGSSQECYDFRFLTESEASAKDEKTLWFKVGGVSSFTKPDEIGKCLIEKGLGKNKSAEECLVKLQRVIGEKRLLRCVVETDEEIGRVFLMFL
ncbi:MAG: hypothetical protein WED04_09025 [Promethearchaeati archaeon SRVP18_Atabeyarchaeia-1]